MDIRIKRVYEPIDPQDGTRILVDRVWPRGMTKATVQADLWLKEFAPSTALRKWYRHDRSKWETFKRRYSLELDEISDAIEKCFDNLAKGRVTLLFSARDTECNQAIALKEYLHSRFNQKFPHKSPAE